MPTKTKTSKQLSKNNKILIALAVALVAAVGAFFVARSFASSGREVIPANWFALQAGYVNFGNRVRYGDANTSKGPIPIAIFNSTDPAGAHIAFDKYGLSSGLHKVCAFGRNISGDNYVRVQVNQHKPNTSSYGGGVNDSSFPRNGSFNNSVCYSINMAAGNIMDVGVRIGKGSANYNEVSRITIEKL